MTPPTRTPVKLRPLGLDGGDPRLTLDDRALVEASRNAYIVVEGVPAALILRSGKQMATLVPADRPARAQALADAGAGSVRP